MLTYCTYKVVVVVVEQCLPVEMMKCDCGSECTRRRAFSQSQHVILMLYYNIVDFIGSCCRFLIDSFISHCLRVDFSWGFISFPFVTKFEVSMIHFMGSNDCPASCRCFANVKFEFWYLKDWTCSLYFLHKCFFLQTSVDDWVIILVQEGSGSSD